MSCLKLPLPNRPFISAAHDKTGGVLLRIGSTSECGRSRAVRESDLYADTSEAAFPQDIAAASCFRCREPVIGDL